VQLTQSKKCYTSRCSGIIHLFLAGLTPGSTAFKQLDFGGSGFGHPETPSNTVYPNALPIPSGPAFLPLYIRICFLHSYSHRYLPQSSRKFPYHIRVVAFLRFAAFTLTLLLRRVVCIIIHCSPSIYFPPDLSPRTH